MGWLVGYTLACIVAAVIVLKIFDYVFAGVTGSVVSAARVGLFVCTWTVVIANAGMRGFNQKVRQLRWATQRLARLSRLS